jgi:hypothetical protein
MWHGTSCYSYCMKAEVKILVGCSTIKEWRYFPGMQWQCIFTATKMPCFGTNVCIYVSFSPIFPSGNILCKDRLYRSDLRNIPVWLCCMGLLHQSFCHSHTHTHTQSCRDHAHCSEKLVMSVKSAAEQPGFLYKISWYSNSTRTFCHN